MKWDFSNNARSSDQKLLSKFSCQTHLFFQRICIQLPVSTCWFTTTVNSSSRKSDNLFWPMKVQGIYIMQVHACRHSTHAHMHTSLQGTNNKLKCESLRFSTRVSLIHSGQRKVSSSLTRTQLMQLAYRTQTLEI